jgi:transposase
MAGAVCAHDGRAMRCTHRDTTSCARTGASVPDRDAQAMTITPGSSTDHRPELTQAVLARLVSQDGGVPCVRQRWEGTAAETQMFQERAAARRTTVPRSSTPRSLVADAQRSPAATAARLRPLGCITRLPQTRQRVSPAITPALSGDRGHRREATTRAPRLE